MKINSLFQRDRAVFSFEVFPPKKDSSIESVFDKLEDGISVADWIFAAVNGDVKSHGLALLER